MQIAKEAMQHKVLAKACGACGCGCPTVMEGGNPDDLVIVGRLDAVRKHTGEGEIAVVIPKRLLLDAARALL